MAKQEGKHFLISSNELAKKVENSHFECGMVLEPNGNNFSLGEIKSRVSNSLLAQCKTTNLSHLVKETRFYDLYLSVPSSEEEQDSGEEKFQPRIRVNLEMGEEGFFVSSIAVIAKRENYSENVIQIAGHPFKNEKVFVDFFDLQNDSFQETYDLSSTPFLMNKFLTILH